MPRWVVPAVAIFWAGALATLAFRFLWSKVASLVVLLAVSLFLSLCLFVLYYGYILLIALNKPLLAAPMEGGTPIGFPIGAAVIVGSWILTAAYIAWANRDFDPEAARLRDTLRD